MDNFKYAQIQFKNLAGAGVSMGDNSMTLSSFQDIDGANLAMSDFGVIGYGTVEPGALAQEEQISFTGLIQNVDGTCTLTGIKSVGFLYPYTETANFTKSHAGGTKFIISNTSGFYNTFANKKDTETIEQVWTFTEAERPVLTADLDATLDTQLITHGELVRTAIAGSVPFNETDAGIGIEATQTEVDNGTGSRAGYRLIVNPEKFGPGILNYITNNPSLITPLVSNYTVNADESITDWFTIQVIAPQDRTSAGEGPWSVSAGVQDQFANGSTVSGNGGASAITDKGFINMIIGSDPGDGMKFDNYGTIRWKITVAIVEMPNQDRAFMGFTTAASLNDSDLANVNARFGFIWDDPSGDIYAVAADGAAITTVDLGAADALTHLYEMVSVQGTNVKYYVDGVLVATITTNLPTGNNRMKIEFTGIDGGGAGCGFSFISHSVLSQKLI